MHVASLPTLYRYKRVVNSNMNRSRIKASPALPMISVMIQFYTLFLINGSSPTLCYGFSSGIITGSSSAGLMIRDLPFLASESSLTSNVRIYSSLIHSSRRQLVRRQAKGGNNNSNDASDDKNKKKTKSNNSNKNSNKGKNQKKKNNQNKEQILNSSNKANKNKNNNKNRKQTKRPPKNSKNIINLLSNPYEAGVQLRQTLDRTIKLGMKKPLTSQQKSIYYLDDRFLDSGTGSISDDSIGSSISEGALAFIERKSNSFDDIFESSALLYEDNEYIPEVLVIGATSEIGRTVVKRLQLSKKFKVRVLVHNLYSETLNMLGTGVTYCQGELYDMESLEYALTDVDKIVFCESPPQKDEMNYQMKFDRFVQDTLTESTRNGGTDNENNLEEMDQKELELQRLTELMEMKAEIAKQVDCTGMQNVLRAYQNVRHADYGTPQAAKRSLFKFQSREEDFGLFSIYFDEEEDLMNVIDQTNSVVDDQSGVDSNYGYNDPYDSMDSNDDTADIYEDNYEDIYGDDYYTDQYENKDTRINTQKKLSVSSSKATSIMKTQVNWIKNKFKHGVFVGKLPKSTNIQQGGSEASIISSRLRSREDPENGIDLSNGFAGFVCRICSDGKNYEAFIRTGEYERNGIEYVCKFQTTAKSNTGNKSRNKFTTVRLPFSDFIPVVQRKRQGEMAQHFKSSFDGKDVKQIGFRINSVDNINGPKESNNSKWISFYLALCYIKVFRIQPEPEFIYFSDSRLGDVKKEMVNHQLKRVNLSGTDGQNMENDSSATIFDENEAKRVITKPKDRSEQELYYKYCGEEMLKHSGLSYSIIRLPELNELASGEFSNLKIKQSNNDLTSVSRAEVAAVCESALLDPNARNICYYLTKTNPGDKSIAIEPNISKQFLRMNSEKSS